MTERDGDDDDDDDEGVILQRLSKQLELWTLHTKRSKPYYGFFATPFPVSSSTFRGRGRIAALKTRQKKRLGWVFALVLVFLFVSLQSIPRGRRVVFSCECESK